MNIFSLSPDEELKEKERQIKAKKEFESLNLDYIKEYDYNEFTSFVSSLEHYNKSWGYPRLISDYINEKNIENWVDYKRLYAVGYVEYLHDTLGYEIPDYIKKYENVKLDKFLLNSAMMICLENLNYSLVLNFYSKRIKQFESHNLIISEVEVVV